MHRLKTQADAVKHFIKQLDIDMIDNILENDQTYQNFSKPFLYANFNNHFFNLKKGEMLFFICLEDIVIHKVVTTNAQVIST